MIGIPIRNRSPCITLPFKEATTTQSLLKPIETKLIYVVPIPNCDHFI